MKLNLQLGMRSFLHPTRLRIGFKRSWSPLEFGRTRIWITFRVGDLLLWCANVWIPPRHNHCKIYICYVSQQLCHPGTETVLSLASICVHHQSSRLILFQSCKTLLLVQCLAVSAIRLWRVTTFKKKSKKGYYICVCWI